jgi:amino acid adenylation domain-containing protein
MSHSPEKKSDLIANRQALLDLLFQEEELGEASTQNIPRRQSKEPLQLSFAQQRLWFLDQWEPGSSTYNLTTAVRLTGLLNLAALERSLNEILWRHEALRTTFATVDGQPVQVVASPKVFALPVMNLQHLSETERDAEAQRLVNDERSKPFDLIKGPLFRPTLLQLGEEEHILLLAMHHIVSDGWSMGILSRELTVLYEAFSAGHPSPLTELSIQYGDFAKWQREWLQGEVLERQLSYWKRQLEGIPAVSNLPADRPRPAVQGYRGKTQYLELTKELTEGLKALSRKEGVTLYMTLLAAFQTLLYRHTRQEDIVVGSPIANRNRSEIEGLIGFFVNTLVLRTDVSGNPSFRELLGRVRKTALDAYEHQDLPFEKLLEDLQPERSLSYSPLFQVMFILQNAPNTGLEFKRLSVSPVRLDTETAKFDLTLSIHETPSGLSGALQYNTDLFDDATITRMIGHFQILLKGIVADPDLRISDLPMLTLAEWHQLLVEWNDTKTDYPKDKCIHELFETQVETTPDAIALICEDQQLTYSELNTRANQLAHYLHKHGVGPDELVGICVERSIEMVIGLLGILKAGGGYIPLDPSYPAERLEFMLADAQVSVLVAQSDLFEDGGSRIDSSDGRSSVLDRRIQRIYLDRDWELIARESGANPDNTATAENLSYVIYTSGSTGNPKGVAIEHRNTAAFLSWAHCAFTQEDLSGVLAATSICFDLSVFEIFAPLTCGGTIVLAENALALATIPNRSKVSLLNAVPSAMNELLRLDAIPASVRVINLAGEPLRPELVRRIYTSTSVGKVYDLYGPSECTTYSTWACRSAEGPQTIGRPIANTQVYILDAYLNPAPIGVVGEIYIGGDGVARGYLNQPALTAERFIYHSFDGEPAQRLYRTGDLARYLPDGNIEFLGRLDDQVKIRGYRIELGEIEAVLTQNPAVRESAVITREDRAGDKQLVAYMVPKESAPAASELRTFLKAKLPEYMVPSAFVVLDSLPLTPNGKVDRQALPEPDRGSADLEQVYVAPRNASEQAIADIWAEILGVKRIGVHDNFFDRGGHSLKATQIVSRLRKMFGSEIPLRYMFQFPTIAELAAVIDSTTKTQSNDEKLDGLLTEIEAMAEIEAQRLVDKDIGSKVSD